MKPDIEEFVRKALELNERDRTEVAARLLDSVEEDEDLKPRSSPRSQDSSRPREPRRFETKVLDLGPCLLEDLDDVTKALAVAEGEAFK